MSISAASTAGNGILDVSFSLFRKDLEAILASARKRIFLYTQTHVTWKMAESMMRAALKTSATFGPAKSATHIGENQVREESISMPKTAPELIHSPEID